MGKTIKTLKFEDDIVSYGKTKEEKLSDWSTDKSKVYIQGITYTEKEIIVFHWE